MSMVEILSHPDVNLSKDAHMRILENTCHLRKINVGKGTHITLYMISEPGLSSVLDTSIINITIEASAEVQLFEIDIGERAGRRAINVELIGENATLSYFGLNQLHGLAKNDSSLTIFHRAKSTKSTQAFRGVYAESAHGIFLGKVVIGADANESSANQLYKAIILGKHAKAHVMPQLEINNHNIAASHGASIGDLDDNALFYLTSRGIEKAHAKTLLITGLMRDIVDHIDMPEIKNLVNTRLIHAIKQSVEASHD